MENSGEGQRQSARASVASAALHRRAYSAASGRWACSDALRPKLPDFSSKSPGSSSPVDSGRALCQAAGRQACSRRQGLLASSGSGSRLRLSGFGSLALLWLCLRLWLSASGFGSLALPPALALCLWLYSGSTVALLWLYSGSGSLAQPPALLSIPI